MPVKTPAEIKYVAERNGWKVPKSLSKLDIARASSDQVRFWEVVAPQVLADAHNEDANRAKAQAAELQEKWAGKVTPADDDAARAAGNSFAEAYPQFIRSLENATAISDYMRLNGIDPRRAVNYSKAFEKLALAGTLVLTVDGQELTGQRLRDYIRQNPSILDAPKGTNAEDQERLRIAKLSADEFKKEAFAPSTQKSVFQQASEKRAIDTFLRNNVSFVPNAENMEKLMDAAYQNCRETGASFSVMVLNTVYQQLTAEGELDRFAEREVRSGSTKFVKLGDANVGYPVYSDIEKQSLQNKLRSMSAAETAEFFRLNPSARAAIDNA